MSLAFAGAAVAAALSVSFGCVGPAAASSPRVVAVAPQSDPWFCNWHPQAQSNIDFGTFWGSYVVYDGQSTECSPVLTTDWGLAAYIACYTDTTSGRWYYGHVEYEDAWWPASDIQGSTSTEC
jgi:hypothetical protein